MKKTLFIVLTLAAILASACKNDRKADAPQSSNPELLRHRPCKAMYHWKNVLALTEHEKQFLQDHDIQRLYVRFFDVTLEDDHNGVGAEILPTATVDASADNWPRGPEIVPTVFITLEALREMQKRNHSEADDEEDEEKESPTGLYCTNTIARKLTERIMNMCSYYDMKEYVKEVQLDCDWTGSTEKTFFDLCHAVHKCLPDSFLLSCTIRLHQLRRPAPPVDYGVLMLYNTNNLHDPTVQNSILSLDDVKPYLRNVRYRLPLDMAYPAFEWDLWFKDGRFRGIVRDRHMADSLRQAGNYVRHEAVGYETIRDVKRLIEKKLPQARQPHSNIIYHLDETNLNRYSHEEVDSILN